MKVLIVGGTSSIGIALKSVIPEYAEVITAGRHDCDIYFDLNEPIENVRLPNNIDTIIHTAAHFGGTSDNEILTCEITNVIGTLKLCQIVARAKIKHFILVSSIYSILNQTDQHYSIYSLSKKHGEDIAIFYCATHSIPLTILRPSPIYGIDKNIQKHQPFLNMIIEKAKKGSNIEYYGSYNAEKNYIYIDDITEIITRVIKYKIEGIYACINTTNVTCLEIAQAAIKAFNSSSQVYFLEDKPNILDNIFEKDNSLYTKIGYYPSISINEGMRRIARNDNIKNEYDIS